MDSRQVALLENTKLMGGIPGGLDMNIGDIVKRALEDALKERGHMTILIAGRSGVGKSTLINAVFQGKMADTGQGRPVTRHTKEITKSGLPLTIWDTRGLEMAAFQETLDELEELVQDRSRSTDPKNHIHAAWLCIQEDGRRVEDAEVALHRMLARFMPVVGVITKARADQGFKNEVRRLLPQARNVVRVRAIEEVFDEGHSLPPMGLEELVSLTSEVIPEGQQRAFAAAQKASIAQKKKIAHRVVAGSTAGATAAGAVPIPFADAAILVPIQVGMLAGISAAFGLELSRAFLSTLVASAAGAGAATFAGRALIANILKFVPGMGTVAGGAISAATAGVLTTTLGEIYIATLVALSDTSGSLPSQEDIALAFKQRLTRN